MIILASLSPIIICNIRYNKFIHYLYLILKIHCTIIITLFAECSSKSHPRNNYSSVIQRIPDHQRINDNIFAFLTFDVLLAEIVLVMSYHRRGI